LLVTVVSESTIFVSLGSRVMVDLVADAAGVYHQDVARNLVLVQ